MGQSSKLSFLDIEAKEVDHRHSSITHFISANKVFCFSLFLFLCFLISTLVSIAVSLAVTAAPVPSTKAVMHLSNSINEIKSEQAVLIKNYQTFKQEHLKIESHLNGLTSTALKNILMDQEIRFQNFLTTNRILN